MNSDGVLEKHSKSSTAKTLDANFWQPIDSKSFKVRSGVNYRKNQTKLESESPFYNVVKIEVFKTKQKMVNYGEKVDFSVLDEEFEGKDFSYDGNSTENQEEKGTSEMNAKSSQNHGMPENAAKTKENSAEIKTSPTTKKRKKKLAEKKISEKSLSSSKSLSQKKKSPSKLSPQDEKKISLPKWLVVSFLVPRAFGSLLSSQNSVENDLIVSYGVLDMEVVNKAIADNSPGLRLLNHLVNKTEPPASANKSIRKRLKVIGKALNTKELNFNAFVSGLLDKYNAKPFLARTSTTFSSGESYFEVNVNVNKFGYMSLLALNSIRQHIPKLDLALGLVIQAETDCELPEQLLMCVNVVKLDFESSKTL